jgi:transcriptional regulator with XRE-family HTH domain
VELQERIRRHRTLLGLTQVELASRSGVSLPTIQQLERGKSNPSWDTLEKLGRVLRFQAELRPPVINWEAWASLGVPLLAKPQETPRTNAPSQMRSKLEALLDPTLIALSFEAKEREREAFEGFLLALALDYPETFQTLKKRHRLLEHFLPKELSGRHIKLKRIATSVLCTYL